jgi:hypothetical protein
LCSDNWSESPFPISSSMALLRPSALDPSSTKADGIRHGERGAAKGRKAGIVELSSEAGGPWKGLSNGGTTEGRFAVGEFLDGASCSCV